MAERKVRMGIDVGGTFTKAVAIDNATHEIIGKASVKTTHESNAGVATGVVEAFVNCMKDNDIKPEEVNFVAHSTTQATNALIEGDVAKVGVVGMSKGGFEGWLAKRQLRLDNIQLDEKKFIEIENEFIKLKELNEQTAERLVDNLRAKGAEVIASSMAFGVDNGEPEELVYEVATKKGLPSSMASDITKLYGLTRRTRTAAINASILPKMLDTAESTESSVKKAGVNVPLMIMRGDGGVMEISEMKKRPVLTMLSGPAASVMGSLMYLRASNGVYFEVGGTTTNIGVIKNGRPAIDYSIVGGHSTFISSLDVQVVGVAGGSMIRANKQGVIDIGPRSAHIGGLDYAAFTDDEKIKSPKIEFFSPREGDPDDYVRIRLENGEAITLTTTCVANALGFVTEDHFSYGNQKSVKKAMQALADYCGTTIEDIGNQVMQKAYDKVNPIIERFAEKYKLEKEQISLVGVGGGAASVIVYYANKAGVRYEIPENAEVISSIGVALAMVRDVVERIVPSPTEKDIRLIKEEAINKAINSGASADTVEVHIEIDPQTSKVTAIATGSTEVKSMDLLKELTQPEAKELAANDMRLSNSEVKLLEETDYFYVYGKESNEPNVPVRILDKKGFIRVQRSNAQVVKVKAKNYIKAVEVLWEDMAVYQSELIARPDFYVCLGARVMDFSAIDFEKLELLMNIEILSADPDSEVIIIAANINQ